MTREARKVKIGIVVAFFLFIIVYAFSRSTDLLFGVRIRDVSIAGAPAEALAVLNGGENSVKISGNARNAVKLTLDGREISVDMAGNFEETIALAVGYNIVSIHAEDKFGYEDEKNYKIILKAQ